MEIIQLHLKHFGKFTDYRLDLHAGINIISGGNETGKSTLHAFIRAMLYGLTRNRSRSLDEYQLREPWENPAYFSGSMKLLYEGKIYRIDRNFGRRQEQVEVICETDGTKAADPAAAISAFTGGLSEADFDNTVFIRQAGSEAGGQLGERLRDYLINADQSADDSVDVSAASEKLKKRRKKTESEKNEALREIEAQIQEKTRESEYVTRDLERLLEKRSKESVQGESKAPFERIEEGSIQGGMQQIGAAAGAAQKAGADQAAEAVQATDAAGADQAAEAVQATDAATSEKAAQAEDAARPEESAVPGEDAPPAQPEDTEGVLLPAAVFLSFAAAILMCVCAWITTDHRMRYGMLAGAVLTGIVAVCLLYRVLHPVSKTERIRKRAKREEFLNRHLGFREDPDDPADRAEAMRRQQKARDQILRAREEEARREEEVRQQQRLEMEQSLQNQEAEDRLRRGAQVQRIARSQLLDREISLRREKLEELRKELEELYRKKAALSRYDEEIRAIELARSRIQELSGNLYHESGADFAKEVSAILSVLTDGRYTRISLDEKNLIRLNTPDKLLSVDQVSYGTMQQVYFALRLASAGLLSGGSEVPILLDEPFAMYDEKRLERALRILAGSARQVILFSCQTRELDLLEKMGLA